MRIFPLAAAILVLGVTLSVEAHARDLQPGMRTMIQRGGTEGVLLGALLPGLGQPDDGCDDAAPHPAARRHHPVLRVRN